MPNGRPSTHDATASISYSVWYPNADDQWLEDVLVPGFQAFLLPLLKIASDGQSHSLREANDTLAVQFNLTEEDRNELLPNGRVARLDNRIGWARTHLKKAGLLEYSGRGLFGLTQRGRVVLADEPAAIDMRFLRQFAEYREFQGPDRGPTGVDEPQIERVQTPEEILAANYQTIRKELAQDLLDRIKTCSPRFFEQLVVDLLTKMGYGGTTKDAGEAIGRSGDGGVDGRIKEDKL